jgi:hypothetical protein
MHAVISPLQIAWTGLVPSYPYAPRCTTPELHRNFRSHSERPKTAFKPDSLPTSSQIPTSETATQASDIRGEPREVSSLSSMSHLVTPS